jgi:transposase
LSEKKRRTYTAEFKKEAVDLVVKQGYTNAEAARNLDIRGNMLGRWRREQFKEPQNAFPGSGHQSEEVDTHEQSSWCFKIQASPDLKLRLI